jgi:hypothetical protein
MKNMNKSKTGGTYINEIAAAAMLETSLDEVPNQDFELGMGYRESYMEVGLGILNGCGVQPTLAETAYLLRKEANEGGENLTGVLKSQSLWAFNGLLYVPNKGVYIEDRPTIKRDFVTMNESDLLKRLESNDPSVRFVPFGFKTGSMSPAELAENEFARALAGEEGAYNLAYLASHYFSQPLLFALTQSEIANSPKIRVASLSLLKPSPSQGIFSIRGGDNGAGEYCGAYALRAKNN